MLYTNAQTVLLAALVGQSLALRLPNYGHQSQNMPSLRWRTSTRPNFAATDRASPNLRRALSGESSWLEEAAEHATSASTSSGGNVDKQLKKPIGHRAHIHKITKTDKVFMDTELKAPLKELNNVYDNPPSPVAPVAISFGRHGNESERAALIEAIHLHKKLFVPDMKGFIVDKPFGPAVSEPALHAIGRAYDQYHSIIEGGGTTSRGDNFEHHHVFMAPGSSYVRDNGWKVHSQLPEARARTRTSINDNPLVRESQRGCRPRIDFGQEAVKHIDNFFTPPGRCPPRGPDGRFRPKPKLDNATAFKHRKPGRPNLKRQRPLAIATPRPALPSKGTAPESQGTNKDRRASEAEAIHNDSGPQSFASVHDGRPRGAASSATRETAQPDSPSDGLNLNHSSPHPSRTGTPDTNHVSPKASSSVTQRIRHPDSPSNWLDLDDWPDEAAHRSNH
ncbi:hypothetical protein IE81DRAFT_363363 [Ceraceosorus guamensis]|uniref:Uncharacterized protein n=1 Tax=Ceraceosorus guamensis TaxID=1522189 RepID=A0A316WA54_9BASI|nr:hypothetical protein IE81DRAFT_363363 [Ceraceosorus guamensis]PWN46384.1 hypothetical protein IE81DRAFT_363363 [Ceraceosorus guamensis]